MTIRQFLVCAFILSSISCNQHNQFVKKLTNYQSQFWDVYNPKPDILQEVIVSIMKANAFTTQTRMVKDQNKETD